MRIRLCINAVHLAVYHLKLPSLREEVKRTGLKIHVWTADQLEHIKSEKYINIILVNYMPLRDLFYISAEYQKLVNKKSLFSSALQKIPAPNFIVFYNGVDKKEDRWENCLSEAYENLSGEPKLELKVVNLNINEGRNRELLEQCQTLREYAVYVAQVRKYAKSMELEAAVEKAVEECIQNGILKEFLQKNKAEVIAVSIFEYDKEEEERKLRKAEFEAGIQQRDREIAQSLVKKGMSVAKIADILEVSEKYVMEIVKTK